MSFFKPSWWRLRKVMRRCYDFDHAVVRPTWTQALQSLTSRYSSEVAVTEAAASLRSDYGVEGDLSATVSVTIRESGEVTGNIVAPSIAINEGATFNGNIQMRAPGEEGKK